MVLSSPMSETETANAQADARLYELGINLVPTLEGKIDAAFEGIKSIITNNGGTITADSKPALIDLAYTMGKNIDSKWYRYNTAYFGWVKFTAQGEAVNDIKEELDVEADVLRYMVLKTTPDASTESSAVAQAIGSDKDGEPLVPEEVEPEAEVVEELEDAVSVDTEVPVTDDGSADEKIEAAIDELVLESR